MVITVKKKLVLLKIREYFDRLIIFRINGKCPLHQYPSNPDLLHPNWQCKLRKLSTNGYRPADSSAHQILLLSKVLRDGITARMSVSYLVEQTFLCMIALQVVPSTPQTSDISLKNEVPAKTLHVFMSHEGIQKEKKSWIIRVQIICVSCHWNRRTTFDDPQVDKYYVMTKNATKRSEWINSLKGRSQESGSLSLGPQILNVATSVANLNSPEE